MRQRAMDEAGVEATLGTDRIRWGPILGGVLAALATLVTLTILGVAIGISVFEPDEAGNATFETGAAIWGIVSGLIAFAIGGWVAAYSSGVTGNTNGVLNGLMVGVATIALITWFVGTGLGNLLGAVAGNLQALADIGRAAAGDDPGAAYDEAQADAWISLAGVLLAIGAAGIGGWYGHREAGNVYAPFRRRYDYESPAPV